jgi:hypothetical protein
VRLVPRWPSGCCRREDGRRRRPPAGPALIPATRAAGVEGLRFHDLRHSAATLAVAAGASTRELMVRMGHSSSAAALRYQHVMAGRDAAIAAALDELVQAAWAQTEDAAAARSGTRVARTGQRSRASGTAANSASRTLTPSGSRPQSSSAWTRKPFWVVVAPISSTIASWLVSGRPRQFIEIALNSRCSIRFHLDHQPMNQALRRLAEALGWEQGCVEADRGVQLRLHRCQPQLERWAPVTARRGSGPARP